MGTVVGSWRLNLIILLLIFSTGIYTMSALFGDISGEGEIQDGYIVYTPNNDNTIDYNQTDLGVKKGQSFVDVLTGISDFLTFGQIDNAFVRIFLNFIMTIIWITIGYILYTFVKEWIPLT